MKGNWYQGNNLAYLIVIPLCSPTYLPISKDIEEKEKT